MNFFADIDKMPFDELVKKYVPEPSIAKEVMSKMKRIVKKILK
jgi:histone H3/H4